MPHSDSVINSGLCGLPWNFTSVRLKSICTVTHKMRLLQGEPHPHGPGPGSGWPLCRMPSHIKPRPKPQRESSAFRSSFMPFLPLSKFSRDPLPTPSFHCRFCLDPWGPQGDQRPEGSRDSQETDPPPRSRPPLPGAGGPKVLGSDPCTGLNRSHKIQQE